MLNERAWARKSLAMYVLNDPQYWRTQAKEMAALASGMKDNLTRHAMRKIASDYELLQSALTNAWHASLTVTRGAEMSAKCQ